MYKDPGLFFRSRNVPLFPHKGSGGWVQAFPTEILGPFPQIFISDFLRFSPQISLEFISA